VGDDLALYLAHLGRAEIAHLRAQHGTAFEDVLRHAPEAGLDHHKVWILPATAAARLWGPTPTTELLPWLDEVQAAGHSPEAFTVVRARVLAMLGRFDEARTITNALRAELAERGAILLLAQLLGLAAVEVELLAGDAEAALVLAVEGCRLLAEVDARSFLSTAVALKAQALYALDRLEEAEAEAKLAADLGSHDDALTAMLWRQVKAKVYARRGEHVKATRLAHEAVAIAERTDMPDAQGDACADLGEVLALGDKGREACTAFERAIALYVGKGNHASAERTRARLAAAGAVDLDD
jgi:ATP/maltotriose-dependent transcriptional regulator MalT